jgi:hemerythrin superfamily protein
VLLVLVAMPRAYPGTLGPRPTGYPLVEPERRRRAEMPSEQTNAVDLIMQDHRELERMFDELRHHPEKRPAMVPVMATLLFAHSRAEEAEVYPAAREAGGTEDVEHSQKEHLAADQLAEKLGETDPGSADFDDVLNELIDAVKHHLEEEEETVLPHMRERMSAEQLDQLGRAFLSAREQHLGGQQEDITKGELEQQAENIDLAGSSGMTKDELGDKLSDEAEL